MMRINENKFIRLKNDSSLTTPINVEPMTDSVLIIRKKLSEIYRKKQGESPDEKWKREEKEIANRFFTILDLCRIDNTPFENKFNYFSTFLKCIEILGIEDTKKVFTNFFYGVIPEEKIKIIFDKYSRYNIFTDILTLLSGAGMVQANWEHTYPKLEEGLQILIGKEGNQIIEIQEEYKEYENNILIEINFFIMEYIFNNMHEKEGDKRKEILKTFSNNLKDPLIKHNLIKLFDILTLVYGEKDTDNWEESDVKEIYTNFAKNHILQCLEIIIKEKNIEQIIQEINKKYIHKKRGITEVDIEENKRIKEINFNFWTTLIGTSQGTDEEIREKLKKLEEIIKRPIKN